MTQSLYAPAASDHVKRAASLAAARHFGHEMVQVHDCPQDAEHDECPDTVVVFEVVGQHPQGWAIFGRDVLVTVGDGYALVSEDEGKTFCYPVNA